MEFGCAVILLLFKRTFLWHSHVNQQRKAVRDTHEQGNNGKMFRLFKCTHTRPKEMTEVIDNQENRFIENKKQKQQQIKTNMKEKRTK